MSIFSYILLDFDIIISSYIFNQKNIVDNDTIWATQKSIAQLFGKRVSTISRHIKNIYESHELNENMTIAKYATVVNRGIRVEVLEELTYYNLDMIISVGYRVNSIQATHVFVNG